MNGFPCVHCHCPVTLQTGTGRTREYLYGMRLPIPDDTPIRTCTGCGDVYLNEEDDQRLDEVQHKAFPFHVYACTEDLYQRVMARYGIAFVILNGYVRENPEGNGFEESREATSPEMEMWGTIVPYDVRKLLDQGGYPWELNATTKEVHRAAKLRGHVYIHPDDFGVLRANPLEDGMDFIENDGAVRAVTPTTTIYATIVVPKGYYIRRNKPSDELLWTGFPTSKALLAWEYELEVLREPSPFERI